MSGGIVEDQCLELYQFDQLGLVLWSILFTLAFHQPNQSREKLLFWIKSSNDQMVPDVAFDPHIYIDAIGVLQGVSN
jgi:hypothetical protein